MSRFTYPPNPSDWERDRIDQQAADHGQDERDGNHEEYR